MGFVLSRRAFAMWAASSSSHAQSTAADTKVRTISPQPGIYCGWPTLTRRRNGDLLVVWSGGREAHVCPFGRVDWMLSRDEGRTWTWPRTILDSDLDDRDAGVIETAKGTLLVTTFTSLAYEPVLESALRSGGWPAERLARWQAAQNRLDAQARKRQLGCWMLRSTDSGLTWSPPYRVPVNSPHGPVVTPQGRLLYAGKDLWGDGSVAVFESKNDGLTWQRLSALPARPGDDPKQYHELHLGSAGSRLLVHIRNHNQPNERETLQTESDDQGATWTTPHPIGVWGLPSHLLTLRDGRLVMSYGHRREPLANLARVSQDQGKTWSKPVLIADTPTNTDFGYPSTVELPNGDLLTVWYEAVPPDRLAVLRQARWRP